MYMATSGQYFGGDLVKRIVQIDARGVDRVAFAHFRAAVAQRHDAMHRT